VPATLKYGTALVALICLSHVTPQSALAITAEVAKKCNALTEKAFPLRVPGNPAAGRTNGTAQDLRKYFNKCVADGGNMGEQVPEPGNQNSPNEGNDKSGQAPKEH
jgi:hypothetical protein